MPFRQINITSRSRILLYLAGLLTVTSILCLRGISQGDFWHADSSRHAMNGVFIADYLTKSPVPVSIVSAARKYYERYPALSMPYHPPLFPLLEAVFFIIAGISVSVARVAVFLCFLLAGSGLFLEMRKIVEDGTAWMAAMLLVTLPYINLLSRSVLLEMPVLAFFIPSVLRFTRYVRGEGDRHLYVAAGLAVAACYTKQTAVLLPLVFITLIIISGRIRDIIRINVLLTGFLSVGLLIPLLIMTVQYSPGLLTQATGNIGRMHRFSPEGLTYYFRQLPLQIGWGMIGIISLFSVVILHKVYGFGRKGLLRTFIAGINPAWFVIAWGGACWLFFTLLSVKYPRHTVYWIPAWCIAVAWTGEKIRIKRIPAGRILILLLIIIQAVQSYNYKKPFVSGPRTAAEIIVRQPGQKNILYGGFFNGNFIFHIRAMDYNRCCRVFRVSRSFMDIPVMQHFGYTENIKTEGEIRTFLRQNNITYLVLEERHDIAGMAYVKLRDVAKGDAWEFVASMVLRDSEKGCRPNRILVYRRKADHA